MRHPFVAMTLVAALVSVPGVGRVTADHEALDGSRHRATRFVARLAGINEVPPVSSTGRGTLSMRLDDDGTTLSFRLAYSRLEAPITVAHVHYAPPGVNGGVMFWFCGGSTKPTPCPSIPSTPPAGSTEPVTYSGEVEGTVVAADVVGPAAQGVAPGELAEVLRILRAGLGYANVHSQMSPGGEVRGPVRAF